MTKRTALEEMEMPDDPAYQQLGFEETSPAFSVVS